MNRHLNSVLIVEKTSLATPEMPLPRRNNDERGALSAHTQLLFT